MATNGNDLIDELLLRHRNSGADRIARSDVATVLTQLQRVVNLHKGDDTATATLTPSAERTLYQVSEIAADVARIDTIRHEDRNLHEVNLKELAHTDSNWLRRTGRRYELFSRVGGSLFVLYPAMSSPVDVTVVYTTIPTAVADAATPIVLSDEYEPLLLDLAEAVLATRVKVWSVLPDLIARIRKQLGKPDFEERGET